MNDAPKTVPTSASVEEFLAGVDSEKRRTDAVAAIALLREVTGANPVMWGPAIVGFGSTRYRYASGREVDAPQVALSPRKTSLTFYGLQDSPESAPLLERLGPHTASTACVYVKDLSKLDESVLRELVALAWALDYQAVIDAQQR